MSNNQKVGARDIMENQALAGTAVLDFVYPYAWTMSLGRSVITTLGGLCGNSAFGTLGNVLIKVIVFLILIFAFWVPMNLVFRFGSFWVAAVYRLVRGVGGEAGRKVTIWFNVFYVFLFCFVYIPFIIPYFTHYVGWDSILLWLKIS